MAAEQVRKGILVVHGIGRHAESSTLLEMGAPLLQWVLDWMRLRGRTAWLERGGLATAETDDLSSLPPAHVSLRVEPSVPDAGDGLHWIMAEAWWAASVQKPRLSDISSWTFCNFVRCGFDLNKHLTDRRVRLAHPRGTDPELWARAVDLANNVLTSALFWVGFVVAIPFVALALILTQVPVPAIQKFTVVHVLEAFLNSNMADMQALVQDEVQAASIRGRILRALEWLVRQGCSELYVIAHSGGVVAAFETLCQASNPEQERPEIVRRVKKFFSLGEGLNKAWLIDGQQPRWRIPLEPSIAWRDFWSAYDPVPVTPLRQELRTLQSQSSNPITSLQVTNRMDLATDHGAYWHNDEQVISRMAQEIDAAEPGESQFVLPRLAEHVRQRRRRVSVLVAVRMWSILLAISAIAQRSLAGTLEPTGGRLWRGLSLFPGVRGAAEQARQALAGSAATAGSVAPLRAAVLWLIGAAIVVVVLWATFQLGQGLIWNQWDYRQRKRLLEPATTGDKGGGWAARLALWTAVLTAETFGFGGWPSLAGATGAAALMALVVGGAYRVKSEE